MFFEAKEVTMARQKWEYIVVGYNSQLMLDKINFELVASERIMNYLQRVGNIGWEIIAWNFERCMIVLKRPVSEDE